MKSAIKYFLITLAVVSVIFIISYGIVLPRVFSGEKILFLISQNLPRDYKVKTQNFKSKFRWSLSLSLSADEFDIKRKERTIFSSKNPEIKIGLLPLLSNRVLFRNIKADSISLTLDYPQDKDLWSQLSQGKKGSTPKVLLNNLKIKNYTLSIFDTKEKKLSAIEGEDLKVSKYFLSEHYKISTGGKISVNGEKISSFSAKASQNGTDIVLEKIDLSSIIPYISDSLPYDIQDATGTLGMKFHIEKSGDFTFSSDIHNLFITDKKKKQLLGVYDDLNINAYGNINSKKTVVKKLEAKAKDYNLSLSANIDDVTSEKKTFSINLTSENSNMKKILALFPKWIEIKGDSVNKMYIHNIKGRVTSNLIISADRAKYPEYYGQLLIGDFSIDNFGRENSRLLLSFNKNELKLNATLSENNQNINVKGLIKVLPEKYVNILVKTNLVSLKAVREVTSTLSDIFVFSIGPVSDMTFDGLGSADLDILSKNTDIKKDVEINGKVDIQHAENIWLKGLALPVDTASGVVSFKGNRIDYNLTGSIKNSPLKFTGYSFIEEISRLKIETKSTPLDSALYLVNNSPLLEKAKENLKIITKANGPADFNIILTGNYELEAQGEMITQNANLLLDGFSEEFKNTAGKVSFDEEKADLKDITTTIAQTPLKVSGKIENKKISLDLQTQTLDLEPAFKLINTSKALIPVKNSMKDIKSIKGLFEAKILLKGDINSEDLLDKADFKIVKGDIIFNDFNEDITLTSGALHLTKNKMLLDNVKLSALRTKGYAKGEVLTKNKKSIPNITVVFPYSSQSAIDGLKKADYIAPEVRKILNKTKNVNGGAKAQIVIKNSNFAPEILITPQDFNAVYAPANALIKFTSGTMRVDSSNNTYFNNLSGYFGSSKFNVKGKVDNKNVFDLKVFSYLMPSDVEAHINKVLKNPIYLKNPAPVFGSFKGNDKDWNFSGEMVLTEGNLISYKGAGIDSPRARFLVADITKSKDDIKITNTGIKELSFGQFLNNCTTQGCFEKYRTHDVLKIEGLISKGKGQVHISAPDYVDADLLNSVFKNHKKVFEYGKIKGKIDIVLEENINKILGELSIKNTYINGIQTLIQSADISFTPESVDINNCLIKIDESDIRLDVKGENSITTPYVLKEVKLTSDYMNLDEILEKFLNKTTVKEDDKPLFIIEKGSLNANEFVFNNLITNQTTILFTFNKDWMLDLNKITLSTAGGNIDGDMKIDVKTSDIESVLNFENMLANAAATTFFQIPNEIYGTLNGQVRFTTKGSTPDDLIRHANGSGSFKVTKGRLVRLGSMEYLLRAANIAQAGITGLNLNNLIDLLTPQKTGYFDTLSLDVKIKDGILNTDNLISKSENLNLYIMGSFDMETNYADLTVLGRLPKKIKGVLGPVGSFSINSMLDMIPGVDALTESNLAAIIPILNKIPGFELDNKEYRRFVVNIEGDFYNPSSVKKFRWLK